METIEFKSIPSDRMEKIKEHCLLFHQQDNFISLFPYRLQVSPCMMNHVETKNCCLKHQSTVTWERFSFRPDGKPYQKSLPCCMRHREGKQSLNMNKSLIRLVKCAFLGIGFGAIGLIINRVIYLSLLPWTRATTWDAIRDFVILLISFFSFAVFGLLDKKLKR